ncbi:TetR/AcrR family transcriptional regulator [Actinocorallia longicatena]|uniref:TetR/AcrR family transcriptional regulator n=1 Tax=Actinocorallia longicatena TaxID=111803 RepID=A0ABP6QIM6_9ACTN
MSSDTRPLRADAERNRRRILDAAKDLFAEQGLEVTLDDIARRAGVGVGTVYRRFANREALVDELFEERMGQIADLAVEAYADPDPWNSFATFLTRVCAEQANDRGLRTVALSTAHGTDRVARARKRILPAVTALLERAQAAGAVRPDLSPSDVPLIALTTATVSDYTGPVSGETWRRILGIVLDGLRTPAPSPLPAPALTIDQVERVMHAWEAP